MSYQNLLKSAEAEMQKAIAVFKEETKKLHTGRATPVLVENILVDYYGSKVPLKQVASISVPEPRMIVIAPWNRDDLVSIQKAVGESDLGVNPQNDGEVVRVILPAPTKERREELKKVVGREKEKAKITIKQIREDVWEKIKELEEKKIISEDDKFRAKDDLQKIVDKQNEELNGAAEKKEEEIMNV